MSASSTLVHYFRMAWEQAGLAWGADNYTEVEGIVEGIVNEAVQRAVKAMADSPLTKGDSPHKAHSSGPWIPLFRYGSWCVQQARSLTPVAQVANIGSPEMTEANAKLISAAPELLDALIVAERFLLGFEDDEAQDPMINDRLAKIRLAIAKAEGSIG